MNELGMLFNAPMVRALLDGRKTQTRRPMKKQPESQPVLCSNVTNGCRPSWVYKTQMGSHYELCPFGDVGDRIWVRETFWHQPASYEEICGVKFQEENEVTLYRADGKDWTGVKWTPSIHMPRWASRLTQEITDVRVQRLQEISEEDAIAEGVHLDEVESYRRQAVVNGFLLRGDSPARCAYAALWENINGIGSWDANPWLWAISFKVLPK
jgi:hypothetical protein